MSARTGIEWTDATWNPVRGCSRVSPGCQNCYAERVAARFSGGPIVDGAQVVIREAGPFSGFAENTPAGPRWTGKVALVEDHLLDPLRWRKPRRIFVNSMSDLFHESLPDEAIDRVFAVMALAPRHTFQILTKRAERMRAYFALPIRNDLVRLRAWKMVREECALGVMIARDDGVGGLAEANIHRSPWPLPNVWLGVSCEDQERADERIPLLLQTPAAVRFVSAEPLLGPVDMKHLAVSPTEVMLPLAGLTWRTGAGGTRVSALHAKLDWVIVGGESGPGARRCEIQWVRAVIRQCKAAGVACFVKQLGRFSMDTEGRFRDHPDPAGRGGPLAMGQYRMKFRDRKGGNPAEWPEDLRVREFPPAR